MAWRALGWNRREAPYLALGVVGAVGAGAAWPVMAIIYSQVIVLLGDTSAGAAGPVNRYAGAFVALGGCMAVVMYLQVAMLSVAGERLTLKLRIAAFRAMLRQEVAFFDASDHSVGALSTQLAAQVPLVKGLTGETTGTLLMVAASIGTGLVIAFLSCWRVALVTLAFTPGVALGGALEMRRLTTSDAQVKEAYQAAGAVLSETVDNIRTVTTLGVQREFLRRFEDKLREPITQGRRMAITSGVGTGVSGTFGSEGRRLAVACGSHSGLCVLSPVCLWRGACCRLGQCLGCGVCVGWAFFRAPTRVRVLVWLGD